MWILNLGNILFKTPDIMDKNKKALKSNGDLPFDMYERFSIKIEKVSVDYHWLGGDIR
jgi:hypothetical protein